VRARPRIAVRRRGRRDVDAAVEAGHLGGELVDAPLVDLLSVEHRGQEHLLREFPHADCVVQHRTLAAELRRVGRSGDRHHALVERGRETPVQPQLLVAVETARGERAEIEELEGDRLLIL